MSASSGDPAAPIISIITATYNREIKLERAIRSVLAQAEQSFEFLIVDDGSNDGTTAMVQSYAVQDSRITYIKCAENRGVNTARTIGIQNAKASWLLFLDSDNQLLPHALSELFQRLGRATSSILFFPCLSIRGGKLEAVEWPKPIVSYREYLCNAFWGEYLPVARRDSLLRNPFVPGLRGGERITWSLIMRERGEAQVETIPLIIYDDAGTDRLSERWKNIRRFKEVYLADLRLLYGEYLKYCPFKIFKVLGRIVAYQGLEWCGRFKG